MRWSSTPPAGRLPYAGSWRGREGVAAFLDAHDAAEEILDFDPAEMVANGDTVFVIGSFEGRAGPTSRTWSTTFVHVLTVSDGHLSRWRAFFDTAAAVEAHAG